MSKGGVGVAMKSDGTKARITVVGEASHAVAEMETVGVSALIQKLCEVRTQMKPAIARNPEGAVAHAFIEPVWNFARNPGTGAPMIGFRHPGLGWIYGELSADDRLKLLDLLATDPNPHEAAGRA